MRSAFLPVSGLLALTLVAAGCASPDQPEAAPTSPATSTAPASPSPAESPDDAGTTEPEPGSSVDAIPVTIRGDEVQPNGRRVQIAAGEPFTLAIDSDRTAELHVHSNPEQTLQIEPGRSEVPLTVDTPGLVDVEEHDTGVVVLQLEVR